MGSYTILDQNTYLGKNRGRYFQVDSLQKYFDALQSDNLNDVEPLDFKGYFIERPVWTGPWFGQPWSTRYQYWISSNGVLFIFSNLGLGEALTFRATTTGVLTTLQHCVDLMSRETEQWKKQLDREKENKNKIASKYQIQTVSYGPYISYGPHKLWTVHILNVCVGCIWNPVSEYTLLISISNGNDSI